MKSIQNRWFLLLLGLCVIWHADVFAYALKVVNEGTGSGQVKVNNDNPRDLPFELQLNAGTNIVLQAIVPITSSSVFIEWGGDYVNANISASSKTSPQIGFNLNQNIIIQINFAKAYKLEIGQLGCTQSPMPVTIDGSSYPLPYSRLVAENKLVKLAAQESNNCYFDGWTGSVALPRVMTKSIEVPMDMNRQIYVNYQKQKKFLIDGRGNGSVKIDGMPYTLPATIMVKEKQNIWNIEAIPDPTSSFVGFDVIANGGSSYVRNYLNPINLQLWFLENLVVIFGTPAVLNITQTGTGTGKIKLQIGQDGPIDLTLPCEQSIITNTQLLLQAEPNNGCVFVAWGGDNLKTNQNPINYSISKNTNITVEFKKYERPPTSVQNMKTPAPTTQKTPITLPSSTTQKTSTMPKTPAIQKPKAPPTSTKK